MTIWIDKNTRKRVNIHATYNGFSSLDTEEIRERAGVIEIEEDERPLDFSNELYYVQEDWETDQRPYTSYIKKSPEQIAEIQLQKAKSTRIEKVNNLVVKTSSGKSFDGNEEAQGRMARAILSLEPLETTLWILADNTIDTKVTREELKEALRLAGSAQTQIWVLPYESN